MGAVEDVLDGVASILLDTAPVIYAVERHPLYSEAVQELLKRATERGILLITTPITLAECVAGANPQDARLFVEFCTETEGVRFVPLAQDASFQAGVLRQRTGLKLPDALQVGAAFASGCGLIFSNDRDLAKRQGAVRALIVDDLLPKV